MSYSMLSVFFISIIVTVLCGLIVLPLLRKLKVSQTVREEGPQSHKIKNGTPTMGGFIFILSITILSLFFCEFTIKDLYPLLALIGFAIIGFADDILKILRGKNLGLRAYEKVIGLLLVSFVLGFIAKNIYGTEILIPFFNSRIDLGFLYIPFIMIAYLGASNAVNLTDGLDGLAATVTFAVLGFIIYISAILNIPSITVFSIIAFGAMIGFLMFNLNPAKVFMGDTGSLAIGGLLVSLLISFQNPLLLILLGGTYVIETLSVIIQVASFKLTGKRVFKMSPIHHHFELCGMNENSIVIMFLIVTMVFGFISIVAI